MKLTQKLLGYLNRVFDKGPADVLALRVRVSSGGLTWRVEDGILYLTPSGGAAAAQTILLAGHTIATLADFIAAQPGYLVPYEDVGTVNGRSALVLIDGQGDQDTSNGDHLRAYTSLLWAYLESQAGELRLLRLAIVEAIKQMSVATAEGEWIDEHGTYYNVPRKQAESDPSYRRRMIAEVLRARGNNKAIAAALLLATGGDVANVADYDVITTALDGTDSYGLFDVTLEIDFDVPLSFEEIDTATRSILESMRDAGTHLRTLRYVRKTTVRLYAGAALRVGYEVSLTYGALRLDGSWYLDGAEEIDGVANSQHVPLLTDGSWDIDGDEIVAGPRTYPDFGPGGADETAPSS